MPYADKEKERANWRKWNRIRYAKRVPYFMASMARHKAKQKASGKRREMDRRINKKRYAERNPGYMANLQRHSKRRHERLRRTLADSYILSLLNYKRRKIEWPKEMIELKRAQLTFKRKHDNYKRTRSSAA